MIVNIETDPEAIDAPELQAVQCGHGLEDRKRKYKRCRNTHLQKTKIPGKMLPVPAGIFNQREENFLTY